MYSFLQITLYHGVYSGDRQIVGRVKAGNRKGTAWVPGTAIFNTWVQSKRPRAVTRKALPDHEQRLQTQETIV